MAQIFATSLSLIKSNLFRCARPTPSVRCFQSLLSPVHKLRCNKNSISQIKSSTFKFRPTSISTQIRRIHTESHNVVNIDTNIINNILLWKFENGKYFRNLRIFMAVQFVVCVAGSYVMHSYLPSFDKYETYKDFLKDNSIILVGVVMPIIIVICTTALVWFFETRSLKYIILNKGGKLATLVSYHPIKGTKQATVPVNDIILAKSRHDQGQYMSVKVKNTPLYLLIDREGSYINPHLFDVTVGALRRKNN